MEVLKCCVHCPLQALWRTADCKGDAISYFDGHLNGFGAGAGNIDRHRVVRVGIEPAKLGRTPVALDGLATQIGPELFDKYF